MKTEIINYGDQRTIHGTEHLDIELDSEGKVVSVWFRCMALPFQSTVVGYDRAAEMRTMSKGVNETYKLHAVKVGVPKG